MSSRDHEDKAATGPPNMLDSQNIPPVSSEQEVQVGNISEQPRPDASEALETVRTGLAAKGSTIPLPHSPSADEEVQFENDRLAFESKAETVGNSGGTDDGMHGRMQQTLGPKLSTPAKASSPARSGEIKAAKVSKRKLQSQSPPLPPLRVRRNLFTPRKKQKDTSWNTPQKLEEKTDTCMETEAPEDHSPILICDTNQEPILIPESNQEAHQASMLNRAKINSLPPTSAQLPQQPSGQPRQSPPSHDIASMFRTLRDDMISDMVNLMEQQYTRILDALGEKMEHVFAQNKALNRKLDNFAEIFDDRESKKRSGYRSTPPVIVPSSVNLDANYSASLFKQHPPPPPLSHPARINPIHISNMPKPSENIICDLQNRRNDADTMSVDEGPVIPNRLPNRQQQPPSVGSSVQNSPSQPRHHRQHNERNQDNTIPFREPKHFSWLKDQFVKCFDLPTNTYKKQEIYSFDGVKLAAGFNRVVATWQGLYFELKGEDIYFENLVRGFNTARGITTWSTKGVQIFKPNRDDLRTTPRPHRFAVIPSGRPTEPCNPLIVGRWYAHVYQTKLKLKGNFMKALPSKTMARTLKKMLGIQYLHRQRDLEERIETDDWKRREQPHENRFADYPQRKQHPRQSNPVQNASHALPPVPLNYTNPPATNINSLPHNQMQQQPASYQYMQQPSAQHHQLPWSYYYQPLNQLSQKLSYPQSLQLQQPPNYPTWNQSQMPNTLDTYVHNPYSQNNQNQPSNLQGAQGMARG